MADAVNPQITDDVTQSGPIQSNPLGEMAEAVNLVANALKTFNLIAKTQREDVLAMAVNAVEDTLRLTAEALKIREGKEPEDLKAAVKKVEALMAEAKKRAEEAGSGRSEDAQTQDPLSDVLDAAARAITLMMFNAVSNQAIVNSMAQTALGASVQTLFRVPNMVLPEK